MTTSDTNAQTMTEMGSNAAHEPQRQEGPDAN